MSRQNAARRNRALRKIRASQHLDPEIKLAIEVILDFLSPKSGYNIAWPSAATIARRLGRSRRTGQWYVRAIKTLGIFHCKQFSPEEAGDYCQNKYGFRPKLDRCVTFAPNLFEVNTSHPLWDSTTTIPDNLDREMGEIVRRIKAKRNNKTTSRLATDPTNRPKGGRPVDRTSKYCLEDIRARLRKTLDASRDDVANDAIDDVVRDANIDVANDTQVFRLSSAEAASPVESHDTPPAHHSTTQGELESAALISCTRLQRVRSAPSSSVATGCAARVRSVSSEPTGHEMPKQGWGRVDPELAKTMERLERERQDKLRILAEKTADRPDPPQLDLERWLLRK